MLSHRSPIKMSVPAIMQEFFETLNGLNNDPDASLVPIYEARMKRLRIEMHARMERAKAHRGTRQVTELMELVEQMNASLPETATEPSTANPRRRAYLEMVARAYDDGATASKEDAAKREFHRPANRAASAGIEVVSARGSAFIRGYLDSYPSTESGAA